MSLLRVCEWLWGNQACRACTFDSPGLPTIGGYPGESRGGEPMPSALYFLICVLIHCTFNMRPYTLYFLICAFTFCKIYSVVSSPLQDALVNNLANYGKRFDFYAQNTPFYQPIFVNLHSIIERTNRHERICYFRS